MEDQMESFDTLGGFGFERNFVVQSWNEMKEEKLGKFLELFRRKIVQRFFPPIVFSCFLFSRSSQKSAKASQARKTFNLFP
jgi:hypothetical protein